MKKFDTLFLAVLATLFCRAQTVANFDNSLAPDTFNNGSDLSGGFYYGLGHFVNDYDTTYQAWSGWAISTKGDDSTAGWGNQYSAITGSGVNNTDGYAVADEYGNAKVVLQGAAAGAPVGGLYVTNTAYTYYSMRDGDAFSKKFGGSSGNDPDWLKLTVRGWFNGALINNMVEFYLADFRFANNSQDYILNTWQWLSLYSLGNVDSIQFYLSSSDTGQFGMNTPAYFAIDNFTTTNKANDPPVANNDGYVITYLQDTLLNVLANDVDDSTIPMTVHLISTPVIPGASAKDSANQIFYMPATGIVAVDTLLYTACDFTGLCDTAQVLIYVYGLSDVSEIAENMISIFPNPFNNRITVRTDGALELVQLLDMNGRLLIESNKAGNTLTIPTDELAPGFYLLRAKGNSQTITQRILKQ